MTINTADLPSTTVGYDEGPHYAWDADLTFTKLEAEIKKINDTEAWHFECNIGAYDIHIPELDAPRWQTPNERGQLNTMV